jgi:hypothetical protein
MSVDLATLALKLSNAQAIADAKAAGAAFDEMGAKGERAALKLVGSTNPVTEAIKQQAITSVAATRGMGAWSAIQAEAAGRVGEHSLAIGRLERNLASVVERMLGLNSTVGLVGSGLLKFGVGTIETAGILGALAAVSAAYVYLTKTAREAKEAADKLRASLEAGNFRESLGPSPDLRLETDAQRNELRQEQERRRTLMAYGAKPSDDRIRDLDIQIAHLQSVLGAGEARYTTAVMKTQDPLIKVTVDSTFLQDRRKAEEEALAASKHYWEGQHALVEEAMKMVANLNEIARTYLRDNPASKVVADVMKPDVENMLKYTMPNVSVNDGLTREQVKHVEIVKRLTEAYEDAKAPFKNMSNAIENFQQGLKQAATGLLQQFSPGNIAQGMANGVIQQVDGFIHSVVSGAVGGIRHAIFGQNAQERTATREAADSAHAMALQLDAVTKALSGNQLGAALDLLQAGLLSTLQAINSAMPGKKYEDQRNAARATAAAQEAEQEVRTRRQFAEQAQYALEDLAVRNLRATGQGDAANLLAFREQQQREMQAAIDANKDALYINTLRTVQNSELLAFQNGLLSTAMRNNPTGFFASAYYSQFATPRGYPTDSGVNPLGPNPTGGLTPPGGSGSPPSNRAPLTIVLTLDGKVVTRTVVSNFDQTAAATGGTGTSRATGMELYR